MRIVFIVNEASGHGKTAWASLERTYCGTYDVYKTKYPHHATEIVQQLAKEHEPICIVAVGGDGTIHEVVQGAVGQRHLIVAAFRAGSGNDFARSYVAFTSVADIKAWQAHERKSAHDIGVVNGEHFFMNNAGLGFDAYVVDLANRSKLKKWLNRIHLGKLSYVYFLVKGLLTYRTTTVEVNEQTYERVWFVTMSNQPYFGGGMKLSPHSKTDDGMLECTIVYQLSRIKLLALFVTVFWGGHTRFREVTQLQGESFTVTTHEPMHCHVDGEAFIMKQSHVHVNSQHRSWQNAHN
ncbi:diacylglycerol/lipid kinase family protein [Caryophanon latum]|uniref:DAGKc domain-containing protein n=1 Tax=Caryophanon latum TaxID=33977 RepID=A0A1C0Z0N6_9BACL|nr:diacylglycerol kinase family protein [Caryophanon latum]OCS92930.1 hypothetical protein A6K76_05930 [Caryophanon latum]